MSYDQKLRYLKLYSLKGRRERGDLIQVYKIFQGIDYIDPEQIFEIANYNRTRNQYNKLRVRHCKTDLRKYTFSNRVVEKWNKLPLEVKEAPSLNAFKNRIDANRQLAEGFYQYDGRKYQN